MDNNLKLIEKYKNIKLIYEVKTKDENDRIGLFNLKTLKIKPDTKTKILVLQTSNPDSMPNYNVTVQVFNSKLIKQRANNKDIGFYNLVEAKNLEIGDIVHLSFNDHSRYDEAPFKIKKIENDIVYMDCLINCNNYQKIEMNKDDFEEMQESQDFFKYEIMEEDWFDDELDGWLSKLEEN